MPGIGIGILIDRVFNLLLNYQAKHLQMFLYGKKEWGFIKESKKLDL